MNSKILFFKNSSFKKNSYYQKIKKNYFSTSFNIGYEKQVVGNLKLAPLPYEKNALSPYFSEETVFYHYEKHHKGYVDKLNQLANGSEIFGKSLEEVIQMKGRGFNQAGQTWNHTFYWLCLKPNGGGEPVGESSTKIKETFGSFNEFQLKFSEIASGHFGSGWAWLVKDPKSEKLEIIATRDAGTPLTEGKIPLLTCDVWEHSYYIDYRNDRVKYINAFWKLVNWEYVESIYKLTKSK
jgi:Fe-Mn family superoxide dismutase